MPVRVALQVPGEVGGHTEAYTHVLLSHVTKSRLSSS